MNIKDDSERRRHRLNFRLTDAELSRIRSLSSQLGLSYTELVLRAVNSLGREILPGNKGKGVTHDQGL